LYLFKGRVHLGGKNIYLEEHQLIHKKGFISLEEHQLIHKKGFISLKEHQLIHKKGYISLAINHKIEKISKHVVFVSENFSDIGQEITSVYF
jgi:hypothetical protein